MRRCGVGDWNARQTKREVAVVEISRRGRECVQIFDAALARRAGR